jgi:hypothetical protein
MFLANIFPIIMSFCMCCHKGCDFFQTLIGGCLKELWKQIDFEPPKLETKHLFLSSKTKDLFSPPQTPNPKPSK